MTARVLPNLGGARLSEILRIDLQDLADQLCADGLDASTVRNTLMPLGAIFRRAVARGDVAVNPTTGLGRSRPVRLSAGGCHAAGGATGARPARSGRRRSTPACAEASCSPSAGRTSTWLPA